MEYIEHDQMEVLEMKALMPEMKITVDGIIRFNSGEEKISVYEVIAIETSKRSPERKKMAGNEQPRNCGAISKLAK